jgi:hypothetical protein
VCENITDIMFLTDMLVNFFAAYEEKGHLVTDLRMIFINYVRGWFILDVIALFPWQWLPIQQNSALFGKLVRLMRLPRIYRLVKVFKTMRMIKHSPTLKMVI